MDDTNHTPVSTISSVPNVFTGHYEFVASPTPLCSMHSLPDDILSLIFNSCEPLALRSDPDSNVHDSLHTDDFPWVLSYVCRRWRALVLTSPLLWSTIQFDMNEFIPARLASSVLAGRIMFLLELSLQRSCNVDLCIDISDIGNMEGVEDERQSFIDSVTHLLLPTTSRWTHLEISGFPDFLETFSVCSLERLRTLHAYPFMGRTIFHNVPNLTELTLEGVADIDLQLGGVRGIELPWSGIRKFTTPIDGLVHLPQMLQLEELHVDYLGGESQDILGRLTSELRGLSSFVLPLLHTITVLELPAGRLILQLFRRLSVPALHTLELRSSEDIPEPCPPEISGVHNLKILSLYFTSAVTSDTTISFLSRVPSVETVFLGPHTATLAVMRAIGHGLLPKLRTLGLRFYSISTYPEDFMALLERRGAAALAVTELRLARFGRWEDPNYRKPLSVDDIMTRNGRDRERWKVLRERIDISCVDRF